MWLLGEEEDGGDPSEPPAITVFASCVAAPPWRLPVTGQSWNHSQWCLSWSSQSAHHPPATTQIYSHQTNNKKTMYQTWQHISHHGCNI